MNRYRLDKGGVIDRDKPLTFRFNGRSYQGYAGDTLASALLANGVRLIGRSTRYHRPRGIMSDGSDPADALVKLTGDAGEPVVSATRLTLYDGLQAHSINCWPGVGFDIGALGDILSALLPLRYYEKIQLPVLQNFYARRLHRQQISLTTETVNTGQKQNDTVQDHVCDVVIAGAGPAGIAAALVAGRAGARVLLVDDRPQPGGDLLNHPQAHDIGGRPAPEWVSASVAELDALPGVMRLSHSTVATCDSQNRLNVIEYNPVQPWLADCLWRVRAGQVIFACGSSERPLVFADNDRPGVMLAGSARTYFNRYAVRCGYDVVVLTNNNSAYRAAFDIARSNTTVAAIVDIRSDIDAGLQAEAERLDIKLFSGCGIIAVGGHHGVNMVEIARLDDIDNNRRIVCDLICHSGGWDPRLQLSAQSGGRPVYDAGAGCFVPGRLPAAQYCIGAARGVFGLQDCLRDGFDAGAKAAEAAGYEAPAGVEQTASPTLPLAIETLWQLPGRRHAGKAFVDVYNDVTAAGLCLAPRDSFAMLNTNMIGILAGEQGISPGEIG